MKSLFKTLLAIIAAFAGLVVVASVAVYLFFDPNEYRDEISAAVKESTGRDLTIEGDLSLSLFPWLAVEVGRSELGNAEGFGEQPFIRFDEASLSVRLVPLILGRGLSIGTASIEGLVVDLAVAENGRTNWDDLMAAQDAPVDETEDSATDSPPTIEVGRVEVANANVSYRDARAGSSYSITDLQFESDAVGPGEPFDIEAEFEFSAPDLGGQVAIRGEIQISPDMTQFSIAGLNISGELLGIATDPAPFNFDSRSMSVNVADETLNLGEMDLTVIGISLSANVEPFSYSQELTAKAEVSVAEFSLVELMRSLDIEPPPTADANALSRISLNARATMTDERVEFDSMTLDLDDSTMVGMLSLPLTEDGAIRFDLNIGSINLDGYMAPPDAAAAAQEEESADDFELPVEAIRSLNANGSLKIGRASLSGLEFTNLELGVRNRDGRLRLHPLAAELYDGSYNGDVRIDAAQDVPSISVNEKLDGVNLNSLAKSMFGQSNITGKINANIALEGTGRTLSAIRQDLDGKLSLELVDGAWEGVDIWHQLRTARAIFRRETPPEPVTPARTQFTSVSATGIVTDGIFENNDLNVLLPFLRLQGKGFIDLPAGNVDYAVQARVLDKPELMAGVTQAELDDFTRTVIPIRISGPLNSPNVRPDIEAVFRQQVEGAIEEQKRDLKNRLFKDLLGGDEEPPADEPADQTEEAEEEDLEDQLKKKLLKDLIGR